MYSVKGDLVVDPFLGMGTTSLAAMASGRNSVGYEIDKTLQNTNAHLRESFIQISKQINHQRLANHIEFVQHRMKTKGNLKHQNVHYGFPVVTAQEKELLINDPVNILDLEDNTTIVNYATLPQQPSSLSCSSSGR